MAYSKFTDPEWILLLLKAKEMGIPIEEVREFLQANCCGS
ncbi:anti-repressor SinI family protein [Aquibacillus rhizosphaerae]|uniref:Anti-repressor SinI family protein n=1 Tax=Aquibacillus rhizosphaerae TaxID=3051431 RepID=A0ABT7KZM6_9BACI|nr:anti-repressor SinI family protein [Aquibacillus sp. LR5S19]MDL4838935.1 anti-repressor SinI family protein [Aquibacillus sp. LR5S19]